MSTRYRSGETVPQVCEQMGERGCVMVWRMGRGTDLQVRRGVGLDSWFEISKQAPVVAGRQLSDSAVQVEGLGRGWLEQV